MQAPVVALSAVGKQAGESLCRGIYKGCLWMLVHWLAYAAQGPYSRKDTSRSRSSYRHGFCCPRRTRWRLHSASRLKVKSFKSVICEVRTGYGTEVAGRSATKEDCCRISVVIFEANHVGSTPNVSCTRLFLDATTTQLN